METAEKVLEGVMWVALALLALLYGGLEFRYGDSPLLKDPTAEKGIPEDPKPYAIYISRMNLDAKLAPKPIAFKGAAPGGEERLETELTVLEKSAQRTAFGARRPEARPLVAVAGGGNAASEEAVEKGLAYLARLQDVSGAFSPNTNPIASTGLALLCYLGAGHHHKDGKYRITVENSVNYLKGRFTGPSFGSSKVLDVAMAEAALAEAYGLSGDKDCLEKSASLMDLLFHSQGPHGGWNEDIGTPPGSDRRQDTLTSCWVIQAFHSARLSGVPCNDTALQRFLGYARLITDDKGLCAALIENDKPQGHHESMTARVVHARFICGEGVKDDKMRLELERISIAKAPRELKPLWKAEKGAMNGSFWYQAFAASAMAGSAWFQKWNEPLRDLLVKNQIKDGPAAGGWDESLFKGSDRSAVHATCLNLLALETYYRNYR